MKLLGKNHPISEHRAPYASPTQRRVRSPTRSWSSPGLLLGHLNRGSLGDTRCAGKPLLRGLSLSTRCQEQTAWLQAVTTVPVSRNSRCPPEASPFQSLPGRRTARVRPDRLRKVVSSSPRGRALRATSQTGNSGSGR